MTITVHTTVQISENWFVRAYEAETDASQESLLHRVGLDWSGLAAAAAGIPQKAQGEDKAGAVGICKGALRAHLSSHHPFQETGNSFSAKTVRTDLGSRSGGKAEVRERRTLKSRQWAQVLLPRPETSRTLLYPILSSWECEILLEKDWPAQEKRPTATDTWILPLK